MLSFLIDVCCFLRTCYFVIEASLPCTIGEQKDPLARTYCLRNGPSLQDEVTARLWRKEPAQNFRCGHLHEKEGTNAFNTGAVVFRNRCQSHDTI